jgi:putative transposase
MAERGVIVDHSTLHRWVIRLVPLLDKVFRRHKRSVGRMDETYFKIKGQWICTSAYRSNRATGNSRTIHISNA